MLGLRQRISSVFEVTRIYRNYFSVIRILKYRLWRGMCYQRTSCHCFSLSLSVSVVPVGVSAVQFAAGEALLREAVNWRTGNGTLLNSCVHNAIR